MIDFFISLLDLCLIPFSRTDNLLFMVPFYSFVICFLVALFKRFLAGR